MVRSVGDAREASSEPKEAVKKADGNRRGSGPWTWQTVQAEAYCVVRKLKVLSFQALWPEVRGLVPILVALVRDPLGKSCPSGVTSHASDFTQQQNGTTLQDVFDISRTGAFLYSY